MMTMMMMAIMTMIYDNMMMVIFEDEDEASRVEVCSI